MGRFDGYYLFSDVDGTLMTSEFTVPTRNVEALRRFTREGGRFALATGRGIAPSTHELIEELPVNAPCVLLNGAILYDGATRSKAACFFMPSSARTMVRRLLTDAPESALSVWRAEGKYEVGQELPIMAGYPNFFTRYQYLPDPWCKLVVRTDPKRQQEMIKYLRGMRLEGLEIVTSSDKFVEVIPKGVSKASGIIHLADIFGIDRDHVLTIGDYYNDYAMLTIPGARSFCPGNAPRDIQAVCEGVLCDVEDGAVADLIERLERE